MSDDSRRARFADSIIFVILGTVFATWAVRIPAVSSTYGLSSGDIGIALLGLAGGSIIGLMTSGGLVSRYGGQHVIRAGLFVYCLTLPLITFGDGFTTLIAILVVFGFGKGLIDVAANAQGVRIERKYSGQIMGSFHGLFSGGGLLGAGVGAIATGLGLSIRTHFMLVGISLLIVGIVISLGLLAGTSSSASGPAFALPSRNLLGFCAIGFCALFIEGVGNDWSAVFLENAAGASPTVAALGFAVFSLMMMIGRFFSDRIVGRLGARQFIRVVAGIAIAGIVLTLVGETIISLIGFGLLGIGLAGIMPVTLSLVGNHDSTTSTETAVASVSTAGYGVFAVGPVAIGLITEATSLRVAFVPALMLAVFIMLLTVTLPTITRTAHEEAAA
ncbi:MFS transporter [Haladaptatus sp. DFWS20]|uniref:MFS transporter n=1 Tax=Haladaptatus sp. DFWS20 TaxID=3403467 RepID=UPI003EB77A9B